ncbi:MAG: DUF3883 domain-containing protein [Isosphaeraceae bacterium]
MSETAPLRVGQTLIGPLFNEPMRVETVSAAGSSSWVVGLVGAQSERFRRVTMSGSDLAAISILDAEMAYNGDGNLLRLGIQAYTLGIAYDFDPYFGLSISRVDPLPHQLEAVYDYLLKLARVRFLLADDAGAGKTIMAGLLIKELKLRGMCERILIVAPANLAFQWQRELKEKFDEKFFVIQGDDIRDQFGVNQWLEQKQLITSLDLAKRTEILPGLRQVHWNLIIVDEAHRMSWSPPARKTARYALGELLRDISDHMLLLTATPHKGDPANFSLFLQLLDVDAYADVKSMQIERVLRDYYAGHLGDADLEDRLLHNVDEGRFRAICQNALEGLASKRLNLEMLIERRAKAQERRVIPETIARFLSDAAGFATLALKAVPSLPHTFDPGRTPNVLKNYERNPDWRLPSLLAKYPRLSTHRETADTNNLEWVTPGHPLFEAIRRHTFYSSQEDFKKGACFFSLAHEVPARIDFYRARVVDGLGHVIHERMFAVEVSEGHDPVQREPAVLGDLTPAESPDPLPEVAHLPEASTWLHEHGLRPFLDEVRSERLTEVDRIADHVELSLTELLSKADEEIGRAAAEVDTKAQGAEGRMAQAETRHTELLARRERRRQELQQERSLTLQAVERITSILVLPHPDRASPEVRRLRPNPVTEATAMRVVMEHERAQGRQVFDVSEKNLGYDITSVDLASGNLRLIEVKGIGDTDGSVLLTPNERRVAEDRRDCYWLYVVTHCNTKPQLREPIRDPARLEWVKVTKVAHYRMDTTNLV